ncbi:MAG: ArsA-related P-loop ATPase, partial [Planctomycetota bacterium]
PRPRRSHGSSQGHRIPRRGHPDELLVLDTAPTGHLLRLLELPSLIQDWLSAIFRVLVKYENLISMPRLNERLLRLSKGLKTLRGILEDADRASVYAVAIPTELCVAETGRLLEGCASRSLTVGGVIINQATTNGAHPLAAAMHAREAIAINGIQQLGRPTATVERGGDLRGAEILAALGSMIFAPASTARQAA